MSEITIEEIASEAAKKPKEVLEKAKELGFSVRSVKGLVSEEQASILYDYIITGSVPPNINQHVSTATNPKTTRSNTKEPKAKAVQDTSKAIKKSDIVDKQEIIQPIDTSVVRPSKKNIQIISRGKDEVNKESQQSKTVATDEPQSTPSPITQHDDIAQKQAPEIHQETIERQMQSIHQTLQLPQGIDPNQLKKPRISSIRVISKNDDTKDKPTESTITSNLNRLHSTQILDSLKHVERKEKVKKKKDKTQLTKQKHTSHVINVERDMGISGYDDEQDDIVLIDLYENPQDTFKEEENKKSQLDEKIKVNRYSPWVKEGSIARPSKSKGKKNREQKYKRRNEAITSLVLPEEIRVYEFAEKANLELGNVLGKLFLLGVKMLKNDFLDRDTIEILANEYHIDVTIQQNAPLIEEEEIIEEDLIERPPVVTIMGHVDHGKTSLLDYIRNSRIASSEAGGITQHIGAYMVQKNGKWISFIDTPGHEAFAQMRSRGAQITDIAVIVIAADDGVKQQSIEALNHAKSAGVQIIIAMNKMDKEGANPDKLKTECAELGFTPIDWGGEYEFIPISAKTGDGVDVLLETILLQAEILELKASQKAKVKAIVLEGSQQIGKGSVATIIVQQGILEVGQSIVADTAYGKVRTLRDDTGKSITQLTPSGVAQITGLSEVPLAGALLQVVESDSVAREMANKRSAYLRQKQLSKSTKVTFDELSSMVAKGQIKNVPVVLRADTQGSLEAIRTSLDSLNNQEVAINVISFGIGGITQSDLDLANASNNCVVLGFNVRPTSEIKNLAKDLGIAIKSYSVIYDLIDDMKALLNGLMSPIIEEEIVGFVSVREIFVVAKLGTIAGCMVVDGRVDKSFNVRVLRNGVVLWSGKIASLKRFKDDVKEVNKGYECGIMLDGFHDIVVQDEFEIFKEVEKQRVL